VAGFNISIMTREEKREEARIRKADRPIYEWGEKVYQLFKDFDDIYRASPPWLWRLAEPKALTNVQKRFPRKTVQTPDDIRYVLSQLLYYWGSKGEQSQAQYSRSIVSPGMVSMALEIMAGALKTDPGKLRKLAAKSRPVLARHDEGAVRSIQISNQTRTRLPQRFFDSPSAFIERLPTLDVKVNAKHPGYSMESLSAYPFDWTAERRYRETVFRRVHLLHASSGTSLMDEMEKVKTIAEHFPDFKLSARPYTGYLCDAGNFYLTTDFIPHAENFYSKWYNEVRYEMLYEYFKKYDIQLGPWDILTVFKDEQRSRGGEVGYVIVDYRRPSHELHV
jgi:hypothetical protein